MKTYHDVALIDGRVHDCGWGQADGRLETESDE